MESLAIFFNYSIVGRICNVLDCFTTDCPANFDYVVEYHKCYKMQYTLQSWSAGRSLCNSISSSHPITIDDLLENTISIQYVNFTYIGQCPAGIGNSLGFFTSGYQTFMNGVRSFFWSPYPGVSKLVQIEASVWYPGEPNSRTDGSDYCIQSVFYDYPGWDDSLCSSSWCVLCEYDMST
ncbi:hypothetical protein HELRODRAFT_178130 [Helobdella robusta]|uniref:C-type lectin domain-containing protein n=1 Tax=Helobdella robusta TaxID=6412 RepID=T1FCT0_HELRO|nr:hypothetical protein HELRODRAFT_178130 [Helobdella robusta]ESN97344.1 hypothetical protein HELRODRAFT_178130 [Helobdella robusta]